MFVIFIDSESGISIIISLADVCANISSVVVTKLKCKLVQSSVDILKSLNKYKWSSEISIVLSEAIVNSLLDFDLNILKSSKSNISVSVSPNNDIISGVDSLDEISANPSKTDE